MDKYKNSEVIKKNFSKDEMKVIGASFENGISFGGEIEQFNKFGAPLFGTNELGTLLHNLNIKDKAPKKAVEDTGQRLRKQLKDLK